MVIHTQRQDMENGTRMRILGIGKNVFFQKIKPFFLLHGSFFWKN